MLFHRLYQIVYKKIITLNFFQSETIDPNIRSRELLTTRLYLVAMISSMFIITLYTFIHMPVKENMIYLPTLDTYKSLHEKYSDTLKCSCSKLAIPYGTFVQLTSSFHQVCSSQFISQLWIDLIFQANTTFIWPMDVRTSLSSMWQLIASACSISKDLVSDALNQFSNLSIINSMILSEDLLTIQVHATLDLTLQFLSNNSMKIITSFEQISLANSLMTGLSTNYVLRTFSIPPGGAAEFLIPTVVRYILPGSNQPCTCMHSGTCPMPGHIYFYDMWETSALYDLNEITSNYTLDGIVVDCTPMQMMLNSSLECFYNQSCVDLILSTFSKSIDIQILNSFLSTRFQSTTKLRTLIEHLFLEDIFNKTRFEDYYQQCSPIHCSYTYQNKFDGLCLVIAFYGGLNIGLRILIPCLINIIFCFKKKCNATEESVRNPMQTSTRLYAIVIITTLMIITIYLSLSIRTIHETISFPSQSQYEELERKYSNTLQCPCTTVSIPYKDFLVLSPTYHQLCQSDFVRESWYENFPVSEHGQWASVLFIGSSHFGTLASLCHLAKLTIQDEIHRFTLTKLTNADVLERDLFTSTIDATIKKFFNSTRTSFSNTILLINRFIHANQYLNGLETNFEYDFDESYFPSRIITRSRYQFINKKQIYCARNASMKFVRSEFKDDILLASALRSDCWIVNSVLESTLACWFNSSCIDKFREILARDNFILDRNITVLNLTASSRFQIDLPIKNLVDEIMIEQWHSSISFASYYKKCRPLYCRFSYQKKPNVWYIIITLICLLGSLDLISWLIVPIPMKIILKSIHRKHSNRASSISHRHYQRTTRTRKTFYSYLTSLNLFSNRSTNINIIHNQRISTRVFLVLIIIGLLGISYYTLNSKKISMEQISIDSPKRNSTDSHCACRSIAVPYRYFIRIENRFHQVCESDFVDEKWIDFLFVDGRWRDYERIDFRSRGAAYFDVLSEFCQMSKVIVNRSIEQFLDEVFISSTILSESELNLQMTAIGNRLKINTQTEFTRELQLLRDFSHGNTYMSGYFLNWYLWLNYDLDNVTIPTNVITLENGCSCGTRKDCITNSTIESFQIPGWNIGCSVVETLLSSTFECFYNQTCVDLLNYYIHPKNSTKINVTAMNSSVPSRFHARTLIANIVNELFIEKWQINVSYASFYKQCNPTSCTYLKFKRHDLIYIISTILSLLSALTTILKIIIPYSIKFALKMKSCCCSRCF